jgi:hypothetical protein
LGGKSRRPRRPTSRHTHGAELVGEMAQHKDVYRLCYIRGPEGIVVALTEQVD